MDLRRLRIGEWLTGAVGIVLLGSLFVPWYSVPPVIPDYQGSAFEVYTSFDIVLLITALLALATVPITAAARSTPLPLGYQALLWILCVAVAIAAIVAFFDKPGDLLRREVGTYIGTLFTIALPVTLLVALRDERLSKPGQPTDATGVPLPDGPPAIETLPAPRA